MSHPSRCFVCHGAHGELESMQQECASGYSLVELFERILGFSLAAEADLTQHSICARCAQRFRDYDDAFQRSERVSNELMQLFSRRIEDPVEDDEYLCTLDVKKEQLQPDEFDPTVQMVDGDRLTQPEEVEPTTLTGVSNVEANEIDIRTTQNPDRTVHLLPCQKCHRKFKSSLHVANHKCKPNAKPLFMCDICGQNYKSKGALCLHMTNHSGSRRRYDCDVCGKSFTQRVALARHMPIHTGEMHYQVEKPTNFNYYICVFNHIVCIHFQCDKCGKQFLHYSSFHSHKLAHDNVRLYQCTVCGRELRSTSHLSRHMLVHSGEKPHACPECGQKFAQRWVCRTHLKVLHVFLNIISNCSYNMTAHFKSHQGIHRVQNKSGKLCLGAIIAAAEIQNEA